MNKETKIPTKRKRPKAKDPEQRENQLIDLAVNLAEEQLLNGTATSQVITHFLNLATVKAKLENEKLRTDLKVAEAKIKYMDNQTSGKALYEKALRAFRSYSGNTENEDEEYEN